MSNLQNEILKQIKAEKLEPKGKWQFILKDSFIWFLFGLAALVGSFAFAVVLLVAKTNILLDGSWWLTIPYFWALILFLFVIVAFLNIKHTKSGYKFNLYVLILISVALSLIIGSVIFMLGWSVHIERGAYHFVPGYEKMMEQHFNAWSKPVDGVLMGVVIKIDPEHFILMAPRRQEWKVNYSDLNEEFILERIQVIGEKIGEQEFNAEEIRPWFGPGMKKFQQNERNFLPMRIN